MVFVRGLVQERQQRAFAFSGGIIQAFQANEVNEKGKIFTGATMSSLAKEFWKAEYTCIACEHVPIAGCFWLLTCPNDPEWEQNEDVGLSLGGITEATSFDLDMGIEFASRAREVVTVDVLPISITNEDLFSLNLWFLCNHDHVHQKLYYYDVSPLGSVAEGNVLFACQYRG
ncbi:hypothetical protein ARMSODRAFT_977496 [Armillaria solidipes]|uniref:Uncharacterized protein n=1 Tax=Armillaria solidipes TaxID=1076256 RepID=A0A2H3BPV2_9AGAR|nr:hypothetical protein ARMSODRAFT_977496 [Armillaria solidipes]